MAGFGSPAPLHVNNGELEDGTSILLGNIKKLGGTEEDKNKCYTILMLNYYLIFNCFMLYINKEKKLPGATTGFKK